MPQLGQAAGGGAMTRKVPRNSPQSLRQLDVEALNQLRWELFAGIADALERVITKLKLKDFR